MRKALLVVLMAATAGTPLAAAEAQGRRGGEKRQERVEARAERQAERQETRQARQAERVERREARPERPQNFQRPVNVEVRRERIDRQSAAPVERIQRVERRDDRRDARIERRDDRRDARIERQDDFRDARIERRDDRRDSRIERRDDRRDARNDRPSNWGSTPSTQHSQRGEWRDNNDGRRDWRRDGRSNRDWSRNWNRNWRSDNRYDWQNYRHRNRHLYRSGRYYSPYRNHRYSRFSIGFFLEPLFFSNNYWISDPWQYRLPPAYPGTQWVRYYDDVLLVDLYTGEVIDVIYDFFW